MTARIHLIAAARPNFMKIAPVFHRLRVENWCEAVLVHTGQHYDFDMSDIFFRDLELPEPTFHLGIGSGSHAEQTGRVLIAYEKLCLEQHPDLVIVVGDVNSTLACTLAAKKLVLPVAHLEAGLRSRDRSMPEELNRIVTDSISDYLWTPSPDADYNLINEGVAPHRIRRVGNVMIDAFEMMRSKIEAASELSKYHLKIKDYAVVTLHRPSNVDSFEYLSKIVDELLNASLRLKLIFPLHPRTRRTLEKFTLIQRLEEAPNIFLAEPLGYISFMSLVSNAKMVITDSGGVQGETTYLGIPCLTLRDSTEQPITLTEGSNRLVAVDKLNESIEDVLNGHWQVSRIPELWDGCTAVRIVDDIRSILN